MIIDAHVHLPVLDGCISIKKKKERLLREMALNQVDYSIVISDSTLKSEIGTLDECVRLFDENENIYVVGGISPFCEFQTQLCKLKVYLAEKKIIGIKLFPGHEAFYLTDERLKEVYELAVLYNIPILFHSGWDNCEYADVPVTDEVARLYPHLKLVCCHCFYPEIEKCMQLIQFQNVFFDLSSIADDRRKIPAISTQIKKVIAAAPSRVLFGSDYSCCDQWRHIEFIRGLNLEKSVEDMLFWKNAKNMFSLEISSRKGFNPFLATNF